MKPMLAVAADLSKLTYPILASPKLDGVRCLICDGRVVSRSLKLIPNEHVQKELGLKKLSGLDGELIVGKPTNPDVFQKTTSAIMSHEGEPGFVFLVFDYFDKPSLPYAKRFQIANQIVALANKVNVVLVEQRVIQNEGELLAFEHKCLNDGFEGVMIRHSQKPYKYGRSTVNQGYLLKLKRFEDSEATIIGFDQFMHNTNNPEKNELGQSERSSKKEGKVAKELLGALQVRDLKTGVEFSIGSGFTHEQRKNMWINRSVYVGLTVKYKFQPTGVKDKPRFPVFLGLRDWRDM